MTTNPLKFLFTIFQEAAWEVFAALTALITLITGLSFLLYPGVYTLSKGYAGLAKLSESPVPFGVVALIVSLGVLLFLARPVGRWALLGVVAFQSLQFFSSLTSVGLSAGTVFYLMFLLLAFYGFLKSGGIQASRGR